MANRYNQIEPVQKISLLLQDSQLRPRVKLEGIWDPFAESNFWFRNLNKTPLVFLKPSSQVNNFTVFFHFFIGM
jgi:hypothetical protein